MGQPSPAGVMFDFFAAYRYRPKGQQIELHSFLSAAHMRSCPVGSDSLDDDLRHHDQGRVLLARA